MNKLEQIIKKYGSGVVDNCLKIIDNPDYKFEKKHDKLHAEALKQITEWHNAELEALESRLPSERVEQDEETQPYASGQANGWNDYRSEVIRLIKEKREK